MTVSIKQDYKCFNTQEEIVLKRQMNAVLTDITSLRTAIIGINGSLDSNGGAGTGYTGAHTPDELTLVE